MGADRSALASNSTTIDREALARTGTNLLAQYDNWTLQR